MGKGCDVDTEGARQGYHIPEGDGLGLGLGLGLG